LKATESVLEPLMRAALAGDEAAYRTVLGELAGIVRALVFAKLGPQSGLDPEDIVQETLLAIHLKRHTWQTDAPLRPWVYAIARYKIIDAYRRRGKRVEIDIDRIAETLPAQIEERPSAYEIDKALGCLSDGERKVVTAISLEGTTIGQTAKRLDMKENAVRVALHRGLKRIAARFGSERS